MDRLAQAKPAAERGTLYDSLVARMVQELRRDLTLAAPNYWIPAALLAKGDADAAWDAAMAGWLRAQMAAWGTSEARADIDLLVQQAIVPSARGRSGAPTPTWRPPQARSSPTGRVQGPLAVDDERARTGTRC